MAKKKQPPAAPPAYRDRIKEHRRVKASDIHSHPQNWREHPASQAAAVKGSLEEVGIVRSLLGYDDPEWGLTLIDGHLRQGQYADQEVEIEVLDVSREEAKKILLVIDPLAAMAETNEERLRELAKEAQVADVALRKMIAELQAVPDQGPPDQDTGQQLPPGLQHKIIIDCRDEAHQAELLDRFDGEGLTCKALIV